MGAQRLRGARGGHILGYIDSSPSLVTSFALMCTGTTNQTKDGSVVRKCRVADSSASIVFSLWNEQADAIEEGDILRLTKG